MSLSPSPQIVLTVLAAMLPLTACSHRPSEASPTAAAQPANAPWEGMKQDEQRAREVQRMAEQRAALEQKKIDDDSH